MIDCAHARIACADQGGLLTRIYFRPSAGTPWGPPVDNLCIGGPNRLLTPEMMLPDVRQYFVAATPNFTVVSQPAGRTLVNFDTIFYAQYASSAGRRAHLDTTVNVLGFPVRIVAEPSWTWTFEPGATRTYTTPGDPYPAKTITHRFTDTGSQDVQVQASWKGQYFIAGDGPYDIAEPVTQARAGQVEVVSARSELIAGTVQ